MPANSEPKAVNTTAINRINGDGVTINPMYALMDNLIANFHPDLATVKIALVWRYGLKADSDGVITLGKCCKCGARDRVFHDLDFIIELNYEFWNDVTTQDIHRQYVLDHELTHAKIKKDENDDPVMDDQGHNVCCTRKHDFEDFVEIVARYGQIMPTTQAMARAISLAPRPAEETQDSDPIIDMVTADEARIEDTAPVEGISP